MSDFDVFAIQLLEEAKRFLEKASEGGEPVAEAAYLHAALMLSFCALEAQVNSIGEEFSIRTDLSAHEQGIILERNVKLENGEFKLQSNLKMARLEDRIEFLHTKFSVTLSTNRKCGGHNSPAQSSFAINLRIPRQSLS